MAGPRTRINIEEIAPGHGSVELPEGVVLYCQNCRQPTHDHGQHASVKLVRTNFSRIELYVDCEICGKFTGPPAEVGKK